MKKKKEIRTLFNENLFQDGSDIYNNNNGQRNFYTTPCTREFYDQEAFRNWCYQTPKTCKEGNGMQCSANLDYDLNRTIKSRFTGYGDFFTQSRTPYQQGTERVSPEGSCTSSTHGCCPDGITSKLDANGSNC